MNARIQLGVLALLLWGAGARGGLFTEVFNPGSTTIPDGNPVGVAFSGVVSDVPSGKTVSGLNVSFTVSGGHNGDLYAYLVAPNGTRVTLLDQPGVTGENPFGYAGSGFNTFKLSGAGESSIQTTAEPAGLPVSGIYQPAASLNFNNSMVDGTWRLFFADLASGGGTSVLSSWSLEITTAPEPVNVALGVFGGLGAVAWAVRRWRRKLEADR
jgi:hypothetical protein